MKAPLTWLREYVDITLPPADLARRLTLAGFEVSEMQVIGGDWDNIVVGQITAIGPHPNADRLRLTTVDLGMEQQTVVCGAPNIHVGDKIAFAKLSARLVDSHTSQPMILKTAKIRGVASSGMVCSEKELGISNSHEGILVLPPEAPVGTPLADYLGDVIFNVDVTPNRPDCLSVVGIAREVAAITNHRLHIPEINYEAAGPSIDQQISIEIIDPDLCPRYCASLITGVKIVESPKWLQDKLITCGQRPINNIVDITNYVMLEYGQPLHSFDYDRIRGKKIIVRRAAEGEVITSLDGVERKLTRDTLVIADTERAVAIAGVMGGANSDVTENTTSILLEAANFNPASIHFTSRHLSLISEASMRFERGISPGLTITALKNATQLMMQLGSGKIARGLADIYPGKLEPQHLQISIDDVRRILGVEFSIDRIAGTLASLGFDCKVEGSRVSTMAPYWRSDIRFPVDLIEEVARIIGYDQIPSTLLSQQLPRQSPSSLLDLKKKIKQCLVGYGFQEVVTYSLTGQEMLSKLAAESATAGLKIRLLNPMTTDMEYLRPNLRPNLLATLAANRRHEDVGIRLFELDKIYLPRENDLPAEPYVLCGLLNGARVEPSWLGGDGLFDFYDAKGVVEGLFRHLHIEVSFKPGNDSGLHPNTQAAIIVNDRKLGVVGEVHPKVVANFEISGPVCLFEIDVTTLLSFTTGHRMFHPILRFPSTNRDLSLVVDASVTSRQVQDIIRSFTLISEANLFDVYSGNQVPAGKKSLAYRLVYQSPTHTLTDEEVNQVQQQVLERLSKELGISLRG